MTFTIRTLGVATLGLAAGAAVLPAAAADFVIAAGKGLTGPLAFVGVPEVNAIRLAVDDLNTQKFLGADHKLVLTVGDDANDRGQAMTLLNRAAKLDKALMFLGTANSSLAIATAPLVNELQLPTFGTATTLEPLKTGPWYFKITAASQGQATPVANYAVDKLKIKAPAIIMTRDNEGQIGNARFFKEAIAAKGVKPVIEESVLTSDTDFSAVATKIAAAKPDSVWLGALAVQAANIAIQLRQAGVTSDIKFIGTSGLGEDYLKAGGSAVENTYTSRDYNVLDTSPLNKAFVENYKKRYNVMPDNFAAVGYSETMITALAIKQSLPDPTREKVRDAIMKLKGVPVLLGRGTWELDANRLPMYDLPIVMVKGGQFATAP
jgi:branched-chain amino acid transport system substrate-binding protein